MALGLNIEKPSDPFYKELKAVNDSYRDELKLLEPFDLSELAGKAASKKYELHRCLIESVSGGSHRFTSKGVVKRTTVPDPSGGPDIETINDSRTFEGWRKVK